MVQRIDDPQPNDEGSRLATDDDDDRLGEAIEAYLALVEQNQAPEVEEFIGRYPDLKDDLRAAMEGLELVHGLVGVGASPSSGSSGGAGSNRWLESGQRIEGYRIVRELGRGGMGTVYEAVHVGLDRPVALKVLGTHAAPDSSARRRFLNEARTAAGLHHTHIVPVFDVGQVGGLCYYAMQRIEGSGLDCVIRHLRRSRPLGLATGTGGPAGTYSLSDGRAASDTWSLNSRLSRLWIRVSLGWPWRQPPQVSRVPGGAGLVWNRPEVPASQAGSRHDGTGVFSATVRNDTTASWGSRKRKSDAEPRRCPKGDAPGTAGASDPAAGLARSEPLRRDDELPPFEPPRGSAYVRWVAAIGLQAADALEHAHHQGVIHRDVKPSNLLVDAKGDVWVTDFGLARRLADPGLTHHDSLLGTPRYMSPEQARTGSIDGRTDVYSLGATLYELLTLRPPFGGQTAAELLEQIGKDDPMPPRKFDTRVPRDLETIVLKALAKRPVDRYATAAELAEDLARFLSHEPVKARRISPIGRLWRVARRHPGISIVTTTAAATVLAVATFAYVRVVAERNDAIEARNDAIEARNQTKAALHETEEANRRYRANTRMLLAQTAVNVERSSSPDRRSTGLQLVSKAAEQGPVSEELRAELRDVAVKFLVLREVERRPELATGHAYRLVLGPHGNRLAVLSEDNGDLALWDVGRQLQQTTVSLRVASSRMPGRSAPQPASEQSPTETPGNERGRASSGSGVLSSSGPNAGRSGTGALFAGLRGWSRGQRLALAGQCLVAIQSDDRGVRLLDADSGALLRTIPRPNRAVVSVLGDPAGQRLVTIERVIDDVGHAAIEGFPAWDPFEIQIELWDLEHLDRPIATLPWSRPVSSNRPRPGPGNPRGPLVALSPDARMVAIAPVNATSVQLFSAEDGKPQGTLETSVELSALALGPNALMAAAGSGTVRLWALETRTLLTSLTSDQTSTRLMRFSPQGTLLAVAGSGPIELWDPVAQSLVDVLPMSDHAQAADMAFAVDGRTLAAVSPSGTTAVWTVGDFGARTQLSGFDARLSSLAFSEDGTLAGGCWNGDIWSWRSGRCPGVGTPQSEQWLSQTEASVGPPGPNAASLAPSPPPPKWIATPGSGVPAPSLPTNPDGSDQRRADALHERPRDQDRGTNRDGASNQFRTTWVAFDSDGRLIAHDMHGLRVWPAESSSAQTQPMVQRSLSGTLGFGRTPILKTPDGQVMVLVRSSGIFLWRAASPDRPIPVIAPPRRRAEPGPAQKAGPRRGLYGANPPRVLQIAPRGDRLYLLEQNNLHIWALESTSDGSRVQARELASVPVAEGNFGNTALSPDGAVLALADRAESVILFDTARLKVAGLIKPPPREIESFLGALAFSPDSHDLAIGSQQGTIFVWSVNQPDRPRLRFRLPGHRGPVSHLVYDAQGQRLASAAFTGIDPLVEVWDLKLIQHELNRLGLAD